MVNMLKNCANSILNALKLEGWMNTMMNDRQNLEWENTWLSGANSDHDRVLLVGDSVTRDIRKTLDGILNVNRENRIEVDLFAATFSILDGIFWRYLQCFLGDQYNWKYIVINYGFHHGFSVQCNINEKDAANFQMEYQNIIKLLKCYGEEIIVMTGNPMVYKDRLDVINEEIDAEIQARNKILKDIAVDMGYSIFDIYNLIMADRQMFQYKDQVHFEEQTYHFVCELLRDRLVL